ncbi:uncharacterized protein LOC119987928 isoform X2 [Tripterygium wilfordii]|uniref:uncharacterized protein LOC119987928 isoform X2 n=1 Tax=Tripterygium wilfordii TaxID=458696 RepID=UPI0018F7EC54|nr:uncharacterized protein LOC119987928 isoform X2 [Tripterygium wilfordii]XP_038688775.1 uncharacterized protein LOC119987928 isoform X2 [Tripterygium wilfordii]
MFLVKVYFTYFRSCRVHRRDTRHCISCEEARFVGAGGGLLLWPVGSSSETSAGTRLASSIEAFNVLLGIVYCMSSFQKQMCSKTSIERECGMQPSAQWFITHPTLLIWWRILPEKDRR